MSGHIHHLPISHSPVFLLNSRLSHFSAAPLRGRPFSRSYGAILPSSLAVNLPIAYVLYTRPPVSVCGTGVSLVELSGFSRRHGYAHLGPPGGSPDYQVRLGRWICLPSSAPTPFTLGIPSPGSAFTSASPHRPRSQFRNIDRILHPPRRSA